MATTTPKRAVLIPVKSIDEHKKLSFDFSVNESNEKYHIDAYNSRNVLIKNTKIPLEYTLGNLESNRGFVTSDIRSTPQPLPITFAYKCKVNAEHLENVDNDSDHSISTASSLAEKKKLANAYIAQIISRYWIWGPLVQYPKAFILGFSHEGDSEEESSFDETLSEVASKFKFILHLKDFDRIVVPFTYRNERSVSQLGVYSINVLNFCAIKTCYVEVITFDPVLKDSLDDFKQHRIQENTEKLLDILVKHKESLPSISNIKTKRVTVDTKKPFSSFLYTIDFLTRNRNIKLHDEVKQDINKRSINQDILAYKGVLLTVVDGIVFPNNKSQESIPIVPIKATTERLKTLNSAIKKHQEHGIKSNIKSLSAIQQQQQQPIDSNITSLLSLAQKKKENFLDMVKQNKHEWFDDRKDTANRIDGKEEESDDDDDDEEEDDHSIDSFLKNNNNNNNNNTQHTTNSSTTQYDSSDIDSLSSDIDAYAHVDSLINEMSLQENRGNSTTTPPDYDDWE